MKKNKANLVELLRQRRVWAGLASCIAFGAVLFGADLPLDQVELTDHLTQVGAAIATLVSGALAVHSYVSPKK